MRTLNQSLLGCLFDAFSDPISGLANQQQQTNLQIQALANMAQQTQEQGILVRDLQIKRAVNLLKNQELADLMEETDNAAAKAGFSTKRWYYIFGRIE